MFCATYSTLSVWFSLPEKSNNLLINKPPNSVEYYDVSLGKPIKCCIRFRKNGIQFLVDFSSHIRIPQCRSLKQNPLELAVRVLSKSNPLRIVNCNRVLSEIDFARICSCCPGMSNKQHCCQLRMLLSVQRQWDRFSMSQQTNSKRIGFEFVFGCIFKGGAIFF